MSKAALCGDQHTVADKGVEFWQNLRDGGSVGHHGIGDVVDLGRARRD